MIYPPIVSARFWSKVDVMKGKNSCWNWTASTRKEGYGKIRIGNRLVSAHRLAWELFNNEELGERLALHKCDNPACCNPAHIYAGTREDNQLDVMRRGGRVHDKLTESDVLIIRDYLSKGVSPESLAKDFGVSKTAISKIATGKTWSHV